MSFDKDIYKDKRILILDPSSAAGDWIKSVFISLWIKISPLIPKDVAAAKHAIKWQVFDIIVSEYDLWEKDTKTGQQFLEELRISQMISASTWFIMSTTERSREKVMSTLEYRPDEYILKPFTGEQISERLINTITKKVFFKQVYDYIFYEQYDKALLSLDILSKASKFPLDIIRLRLVCFLKKEDYHSMVELYNSIAGNPKLASLATFPWLRYAYSKALYHLGKYQEAEVISADLKAKFPHYMENYRLLVDILHVQKKDEESLLILQEAVSLSPLNMERQLLLWQKALLQWDLGLAQKAHQTVIEKWSNSCVYSIDTHTNLAHIYWELGQFDEALTALAQWVKALKDSDPVGVEFASSVMESQIFSKKWEPDKAKVAFDKALHIYDHAIVQGEGWVPMSDDMKMFFSAECLENWREDLAKWLIAQVMEKSTHREDIVQEHLKKVVRNPENIQKVDKVIEQAKIENAPSMYEQILSQGGGKDVESKKFQDAMKMIESGNFHDAALLLEEIVDGVFNPEKSYYQNAFEIAKNGDWKKSLSLLRLESIRNPENPRSYFDLGQITLFYINNSLDVLLKDLRSFEKLYTEALTYFETGKVLAWAECETTFASNIRQFTMVEQRIQTRKTQSLSQKT